MTVSDIKASLKWETERARQVLVCEFWNGPERRAPDGWIDSTPAETLALLCWPLALKAAVTTEKQGNPRIPLKVPLRSDLEAGF